MFPITKSNSTNFWNSSLYVPGSLITISIIGIGIGIKWLINQSSVGCLANSFNINRRIKDTPSDSEQVKATAKIYEFCIKRPPNRDTVSFSGTNSFNINRRIKDTPSDSEQVKATAKIYELRINSPPDRESVIFVGTIPELIDRTDAECSFVIRGKKYNREQLRSDHAKILMDQPLIYIMPGSNNDNTSPLPTNSEASLLVREPNNSNSSKYFSTHISTIKLLNPSNSGNDERVVRFFDKKTDKVIHARDCIELIQATGIELDAIPQHFQLLCCGHPIKGDEDVSSIKGEKIICINLKPSANEMELLFNFFSSPASIQTIDNAITSEYYRCVQGEDLELSDQGLENYKKLLVDGLSLFDQFDSQDCDWYIKQKIIFYLNGLIGAIQDIENFNRSKRILTVLIECFQNVEYSAPQKCNQGVSPCVL